MAVRDELVNLSHEELAALCDEHDALIGTLQERLDAAEAERDRALAGLHLLTEALRRRGCCDHETNGGAF